MSQDQQTPQATDQAKVGVYICHCGGNISDHVDVEEVRQRMEEQPGVAVARTNMFMCSDPGQEQIMQDLQSGKVDRVVVASCAPSLHETTFRGAIARAGANPYIYEHANIREQVSWVHHGQPATDKACRLVSAAAAKAAMLRPLDPIRVEAWRHATVVGGGVAGMRAALSLAERGIAVALVEKTPFLGGQVAGLNRLAPSGEDAGKIVRDLAAEVLAHSGITVHASAQVTGFDGYIGNFRLTLTQGPGEQDLPAAAGSWVPGKGVCCGRLPRAEESTAVETGVVVMATGFRSYEPRQGEYGYGQEPQVLTLPELEYWLAQDDGQGPYLEVDGRAIRSMALIHCVGSRQIPGIHEEEEGKRLNEYCSRTCCASLLHAAAQIRGQHPGTQVYDYYRDIRTYARGQEELYTEAAEKGVVFMRFEAEDPPQVAEAPRDADHPLTVTVKDTLTFGEEIQAPVDLVVLATGMEPNDISGLVEMMKLPVGVDGFLLEVHPKLRPVELPTAGLLLAGTCQAPMNVAESASAASAAAVKAAGVLARGQVELDPFVAEVDLAKCAGCGECMKACLGDGALNLVEIQVYGQAAQRAQVTPALCLGCGACVAVCPEDAIQVSGMTLEQYEAMVERIVAGQAAA